MRLFKIFLIMLVGFGFGLSGLQAQTETQYYIPGGGGGSDLDSVIAFNILQDSIFQITLMSGQTYQDTFAWSLLISEAGGMDLDSIVDVSVQGDTLITITLMSGQTYTALVTKPTSLTVGADGIITLTLSNGETLFDTINTLGPSLVLFQMGDDFGRYTVKNPGDTVFVSNGLRSYQVTSPQQYDVGMGGTLIESTVVICDSMNFTMNQAGQVFLQTNQFASTLFPRLDPDTFSFRFWATGEESNRYVIGLNKNKALLQHRTASGEENGIMAAADSLLIFADDPFVIEAPQIRIENPDLDTTGFLKIDSTILKKNNNVPFVLGWDRDSQIVKLVEIDSLPGGSGIGGSGTLNRLAKFTPDGTHIGDSQFYDDGTRVGLGTTSPSVTAYFEIRKAGLNQLRLAYDGSNYMDFFVTTTGNLYLTGNGGRLGIGDPTPDQSLDVVGGIALSGEFAPNDDAGNANEILMSQGSATYPVWDSLRWANLSVSLKDSIQSRLKGVGLDNRVAYWVNPDSVSYIDDSYFNPATQETTFGSVLLRTSDDDIEAINFAGTVKSEVGQLGSEPDTLDGTARDWEINVDVLGPDTFWLPTPETGWEYIIYNSSETDSIFINPVETYQICADGTCADFYTLHAKTGIWVKAFAEATEWAVIGEVTSTGGGGGSGNISGTLTDGYIVNASGTNTIEDSPMYTDGTNVSLGAATTIFSKFGIQTNSLGTTQTNDSGLTLRNNTAATSGNQQISNALRWRGNGYRVSGGVSVPVDWMTYVLPIQGTANPSSALLFLNAIDNGSYDNVFSLSSAGLIYLGSPASSDVPYLNRSSGASDAYVGNGRAIVFSNRQQSTSGDIYGFKFTSPTSVSKTSGSYIVNNVAQGFAPTSGTCTFSGFEYNGTINQTGSTGVSRGYYSNPTLTAAADWRSFESSNNTGYSYYGAGTAPSYFGGDVTIRDASTDIINFKSSVSGRPVGVLRSSAGFISFEDLNGNNFLSLDTLNNKYELGADGQAIYTGNSTGNTRHEFLGNSSHNELRTSTSTTVNITGEYGTYEADITSASGDITYDLPAGAAALRGEWYIIAEGAGGGNDAILNPAGTDEINGVNAAYNITSPGLYILKCDSQGNWWVK